MAKNGFYMCMLLLTFVRLTDGAACSGSSYGRNTPKTLDANVDTSTGIEVRATSYVINCDCGIITEWQFFARTAGTVIFYVLDGTSTTVKGQTSITILEQSKDNYFGIPLSVDTFVSVKNGDTIGFFCAGEGMITYTGGSNVQQGTGKSAVANGGSLTGTTSQSRDYAFAAKVEAGHAPFFANAVFERSMYTHETGNVVFTATIGDYDPGDVPNLVLAKASGDSEFSLDPVAKTLTYDTVISDGTKIVELTLDDGCHSAVTGAISIVMFNEGPVINNLPASVTQKDQNGVMSDFTIGVTDPSGDTVTCRLDSTLPTGGPFSVTGNVIRQTSAITYSTAKFYDVQISCTDGATRRYSNFQVDVEKNEPPYYTAGANYLPASVATDRSAGGAALYTAVATDPEGDSLTYSRMSCTPGDCAAALTFAGGVVTKAADLTESYYELGISVTDGKGNTVGPYTLSILVSTDQPLTFNADPLFTNLPAAVTVVENTVAGTYLYRVAYRDENTIMDTYTLSKVSVSHAFVDTYFQFDTATGSISVKAPIDYDTITPKTGLTMTLGVSDGVVTTPINGILTINIANVNEAPTIAIATPALTFSEMDGNSYTSFPTQDPGLSVTDPDIASVADTHYYKMDCGSDSKYFQLNSAQVELAREYDMDSGLSGTATCVVTVVDSGGLTDSGTITITVTNINDHTPRFPHQRYLFLLYKTTPFLSMVENLAATDLDSNQFGSTTGTLTYSFQNTATNAYLRLEQDGILYVNDLTSFSSGTTQTFVVLATDSGGLIGSSTVSILIADDEVPASVTTTERSFLFREDAMNVVWVFVLGIMAVPMLLVISWVVYNDPTFHQWLVLMMLRIRESCREEQEPPIEPMIPKPGKLTVTINNQKLEHDPENPLPWELADDDSLPETNEVQDDIDDRLDERMRRNHGGDVSRATTASDESRKNGHSPQYASFDRSQSLVEEFQQDEDSSDDGGGSGQWGDLGAAPRASVSVTEPTHDEWNDDDATSRVTYAAKSNNDGKRMFKRHGPNESDGGHTPVPGLAEF